MNGYIRKSLELHLFFGRIMKEHSFFLKAGFTPANADFSVKAEFFKRAFEQLLSRAVMLSRGIVSDEVLCSGELVTEFTALAENQSERLTGIAIDKSITKRQLIQQKECGNCGRSNVSVAKIRELNNAAIGLLNGLISFKQTVLEKVLCGKMFTANYPLLIEHIIREAKLYRKYLIMLEEDGDIESGSMKSMECFWNQIMMEHAMFIRGLLDPGETELLNTADDFANDYAALLKACSSAHSETLTDKTLEKTEKFRDFKAAGTEGIEQCKIRSIILPLLADHVLREANHYIRLLKE